jgi:hypothetical protein
MPENTEFREELKRVVRTNDPAPDELRAAAAYLEATADKWETMDDTSF